MQLLYSVTSPYARKCLVLAHEYGIVDQIEVISSPPSPVERNETVFAANPAGKIPTLLRANGTALHDSRVICQYLDTLHAGASAYPRDGDERWAVLRRESMADAMLDAAIIARYESALRPKELYWDVWHAGQMSKIVTTLNVLEQEVAPTGVQAEAGDIAIACALGYLDFRFPDFDWRADRRELTGWYEAFSARPSMVATDPNG